MPQSSFLLVQPTTLRYESAAIFLALLLSSCQVSTAFPPPLAPPLPNTLKEKAKKGEIILELI